MEPVPGLVPGLADVAGLFPVPGLAKPVRGLPLPVTGRTAWLDPCQKSMSHQRYTSSRVLLISLKVCTLPAALVTGRLKDVPGLAVCATAFSSNKLSAMPCMRRTWQCGKFHELPVALCSALTSSSTSVSSTHTLHVSARVFKCHTACRAQYGAASWHWVAWCLYKAGDHT